MKIQDLILKFPHLPEQIFQKLDNESLSKSREVSKFWKNVIDGKNCSWLRIVNIPTILNNGNTYLHLGAKTGQIEAYKNALAGEEDKYIRNEFNETSFLLACKNGRFQIVQLACQSGKSDENKILMENTCSFNIGLNRRDKYWMTGFHWACDKGYFEVVKILIGNAVSLSIDLNATMAIGNNAFHIACYESFRCGEDSYGKCFFSWH